MRDAHPEIRKEESPSLVFKMSTTFSGTFTRQKVDAKWKALSRIETVVKGHPKRLC